MFWRLIHVRVSILRRPTPGFAKRNFLKKFFSWSEKKIGRDFQNHDHVLDIGKSNVFCYDLVKTTLSARSGAKSHGNVHAILVLNQVISQKCLMLAYHALIIANMCFLGPKRPGESIAHGLVS